MAFPPPWQDRRETGSPAPPLTRGPCTVDLALRSCGPGLAPLTDHREAGVSSSLWEQSPDPAAAPLSVGEGQTQATSTSWAPGGVARRPLKEPWDPRQPCVTQSFWGGLGCSQLISCQQRPLCHPGVPGRVSPFSGTSPVVSRRALTLTQEAPRLR